MMMNKVLALSGGVGGAKLALGLSRILSPDELSIIANTGDDQKHMGLMVCPDIDTLIYTLAGVNNKLQGWGLEGESWRCMEALDQIDGDTWFKLGDRDIATHLKRNAELEKGRTLTEVTALICRAFGVEYPILPMCDEAVSTLISVYLEGADQTTLLPFHDYFVKYQCQPEVESIHFLNAENATLTDQVRGSIAAADSLIVCPSNPFLSIDPVFAVPALKQTLQNSIEKRVVVSPIIAGEAVKGPAAKIMKELKLPCTSLAIAERYKDFATHFVLDVKDSEYADDIKAMGLSVLVTQTYMQTEHDKIDLAKAMMAFIGASIV